MLIAMDGAKIPGQRATSKFVFQVRFPLSPRFLLVAVAAFAAMGRQREFVISR